MSTIAVNTITDASGGSTAQINGATPTVYNTMGRNRIINGGMVIDQRNAGASYTQVNGAYNLDRWAGNSFDGGAATSKFSVQQSSTAPTGFSTSMLVTSLAATADGASNIFNIEQKIEGFNTADLGFGTASAKTITISFWVRSSLTGTFGGAIKNSARNRAYPFTYSISSANTFEYKTVTIAGDTTGTWVGSTNGTGLWLSFGLGVGSSYSGTAGAWNSSDNFSATGATSVVGTNGATFYLTGVQLEVGSVATEFERRPYGTELQLCQRYYEQYKDQIANAYVSVRTGSYYGYITWQVPKRAAPSIGSYTSFNFAGSAGDINTVTSAVFDNQQVNNTRFYANSVGPFTAQSAYVYVNGTLAISAEL